MGFLTERAGIYLQEYFPTIANTYLSFMVLLAIMILQFIGGKAIAVSQYISICCTIFPLITIVGLCITKASWHNLIPFAPFGYAAAIREIPAVIFGFMGFETITTLYAVVEDPKKTLPRALNYAVLAVGTIYLIFIGTIFATIPAELFANASVPLSQPFKQLFPEYHWLVNLIHASMTIAFISVINAVSYAMSQLILPLRPFGLSRIKDYARLTSIIDVLLLIYLAFRLLKTPDLFFAVASMLLMIPFLTSFITLLTLPRERTVVTYITCATTVIVFCSAVYNVAQQLL